MFREIPLLVYMCSNLSYFVVLNLRFVLLCHILYSSEPVYSNVLFMNSYVCVVNFIDTVILQ